MTHYILAGGSDRQYENYTKKLSDTVRPWLSGATKVLSCQFAKKEEIWEEVFETWKPLFRQYFGDDIEARLAFPDTFLNQVAWADVVYIHGGRTKNLLDIINSFENLEERFKGKIIIGSSAGTNFLSKTYFSPKQNQVGTGSGIVPLNTVVHYGASSDGEVSLTKDQWNKVVGRMKDAIGNEELTLIPEGEFVVFEK